MVAEKPWQRNQNQPEAETGWMVSHTFLPVKAPEGRLGILWEGAAESREVRGFPATCLIQL